MASQGIGKCGPVLLEDQGGAHEAPGDPCDFVSEVLRVVGRYDHDDVRLVARTTDHPVRRIAGRISITNRIAEQICKGARGETILEGLVVETIGRRTDGPEALRREDDIHPG